MSGLWIFRLLTQSAKCLFSHRWKTHSDRRPIVPGPFLDHLISRVEMIQFFNNLKSNFP